jgi:hypothetical protein
VAFLSVFFAFVLARAADSFSDTLPVTGTLGAQAATNDFVSALNSAVSSGSDERIQAFFATARDVPTLPAVPRPDA